MKKVLVCITALLMVIGLLGCGGKQSNITLDDLVRRYKDQVDDEVTINDFTFTEVEHGFAFEFENISGNTDKEKYLTKIQIVCQGVETNWVKDADSIQDFLSRFLNLDYNSMSFNQLSVYFDTLAAIDTAQAVYETVSGAAESLDEAIAILTASTALQVEDWIITSDIDQSTGTVTITAIYG